MPKIIAVIIVLAMLALGGYTLLTKGPAPADRSDDQALPASGESFVLTGTIRDLLKRAGSYKCTFAQSVEVADTTGTVYIANDGTQLRGDFVSAVKQPAMTVSSHLVREGAWIYTWSDAFPQGFKVPVDETGMGGGENQAFNFDQELEYACEPWTADASLFVIPNSITFTEINPAQ